MTTFRAKLRVYGMKEFQVPRLNTNQKYYQSSGAQTGGADFFYRLSLRRDLVTTTQSVEYGQSRQNTHGDSLL